MSSNGNPLPTERDVLLGIAADDPLYITAVQVFVRVLTTAHIRNMLACPEELEERLDRAQLLPAERLGARDRLKGIVQREYETRRG